MTGISTGSRPLRVNAPPPAEPVAPTAKVRLRATPESALPPAGTDRTNLAPADWRGSGAAQSREGVVRVTGDAFTGSGWVISPGTVVTNHHVVAGNTKLTVIDHEGVTRAAEMVADDPANDLAILRVAGLDATPLRIDDSVDAQERAEVSGYPNRTFTQSPAIVAGGYDLEINGDSRRILVLAGDAGHGASGGPILNGSGEVIGTIFGSMAMPSGTGAVPIITAVPTDAARRLAEQAGQ